MSSTSGISASQAVGFLFGIGGFFRMAFNVPTKEIYDAKKFAGVDDTGLKQAARVIAVVMEYFSTFVGSLAIIRVGTFMMNADKTLGFFATFLSSLHEDVIKLLGVSAFFITLAALAAIYGGPRYESPSQQRLRLSN
jgi:hypothetical protein